MHQLIDKKNRIIIYLIFLLILSTVSSKNIENKRNYSINIDKINVSGLSSDNNFKLTGKLKNFLNKNILTIERKDLIEAISKYNNIEDYDIKKIYPSVLNIKIKPAKYIAKISGKKNLIVGSNGKLIKTNTINETLPKFYGKFNSKEFLKFKRSIESSKFNFQDLKIIYYYSSKRWDVLTKNNILIKLPEKNLLDSLNFANRIIVDDQFKKYNLIDLRVDNHLIVQ